MRSMLAAFAVFGRLGHRLRTRYEGRDFLHLLPNPAVVDCLRANPFEEPRAHATVIRASRTTRSFSTWTGSSQVSRLTCSPFRTASFKPMTPKTQFHGKLWFGLVSVRYQDWQANGRRPCPDQNDSSGRYLRFLIPTCTWLRQTRSISASGLTILWMQRLCPAATFDPTKPTPFNGEHKADRLPCSVFPTLNPDWDPSARTRTIPQPRLAATQTELAAAMESGAKNNSPRFPQNI